jgi:phosphopantothenoylcysteine decarboxylase/phosphopantothenate--cysteine ligase
VVSLVAGPVSLNTPAGVERIDVQSAAQMFEACKELHASADIIIMTAAVADYTPEIVADEKIKKNSAALSILLKPTIDILAFLGSAKPKHQYLVGFALETQNEIENAKKKLHTKNLDLIVLNSLREKGAGFAGITNKVYLIDKQENIVSLPLKHKTEVATDIVDYLIKQINA